MQIKMEKKIICFRLTDDCNELISKLSEAKGISRASIIELLVREAAKKEKIK